MYFGSSTVMYSNYKTVYLNLKAIYPCFQLYDEPCCPPGACVACTTAVIAAQEFRLLVKTSTVLWSKAITSLSNIPDQYSPPIKSLCAFIRKDNLTVQTIKDYTGNDPKTILNQLTTKLSPKKKDSSEKRPRLARSGPPCSCTDCGQQFLSPYYLSLHLKNSGQKEACLLCGTIVIRGQEMKDHMAIVHREKTYLCNSCPALFTREPDMKKHLKTAHRPGSMTCGDCGRSFPRAGAFEAHSQMHAVRTCRACGSQFTNRGCYRRHRSQCEPDARPDPQNLPRNKRCNIRDPATFTCDHCGKTYHSRPQLKNHIIWIHMDVRPHQCQWCGKRFYTTSRLAEHTIVHTRERNFECDICGVKLVSKMAAVYHRRRHTGEKPYECEDCGERFISASRRSEHAKRRHFKGKRLGCSQCSATFVRNHELKKHIDKAHAVKQEGMLYVLSK